MTTQDFTLTWTLPASPATVFRAWTDPDHLGWFWNPEQPIPDEEIELDLRVGGAWRQRMVIDEETDYVTGGIYREIAVGEKLVFSWGAVGGWPALDPDRLEDSPLVTVTLRAVEEGTRLTLHVQVPASLPADGVPGWWSMARAGWHDTVDRLAAQLAPAPATGMS